MHRRRRHRPRQMDAHQQIGVGGDGEAHGIAERLRPRPLYGSRRAPARRSAAPGRRPPPPPRRAPRRWPPRSPPAWRRRCWRAGSGPAARPRRCARPAAASGRSRARRPGSPRCSPPNCRSCRARCPVRDTANTCSAPAAADALGSTTELDLPPRSQRHGHRVQPGRSGDCPSGGVDVRQRHGLGAQRPRPPVGRGEFVGAVRAVAVVHRPGAGSAGPPVPATRKVRASPRPRTATGWPSATTLSGVPGCRARPGRAGCRRGSVRSRATSRPPPGPVRTANGPHRRSRPRPGGRCH